MITITIIGLIKKNNQDWIRNPRKILDTAPFDNIEPVKTIIYSRITSSI